MLAKLYYLFPDIQKSNKQVISVDIVEYILLKYSQIIGCHNNWIILNFADDGTEEKD